MQFFRRRRRRKQVQQILSIDMIGVRANSLERLTDDHLASLARIASVSKSGSSRSEFREVVQILLSDGHKAYQLANGESISDQLRALARSERDRQYADRKQQQLAKSLLDKVAPDINAQLPDRCSADEEKCVERLKSLLNSEKDVDQVLKSFALAFRASPTEFVDHPEALYRRQASEILLQIESSLLQSLPRGARLNQSECEDLLATILANGVKNDQIVERFVTAVRLDGETYVSGVKLPTPEEMAQSIYDQIEASFAAAMPPDCTPRRGDCITAIAQLLSAGMPPKEIVQSFMKLVESAPMLYLNMPVPKPFRASSFSSSAPVSTERSEMRR